MAVAHLKLPMSFDVARLQTDLAGMRPEEWTAHFNTSYYDGLWSGIALRTTEGAHVPLYPDPSKSTYVDLEVLERCPYIAEVMAAFHCPLQLVRLLKLSPGSNIKEHSDYNLSYEDGEVRVHIPIQTNPEVEFAVDGAGAADGRGRVLVHQLQSAAPDPQSGDYGPRPLSHRLRVERLAAQYVSAMRPRSCQR